MRLLLAEDERDLSNVEKKILEHAGYEVDAAFDGEEALQYARNHAYDCMIFDIMMPNKDGVTLLREIRADGDVTPVIMLTAKTEVDDRIDGLDAGADDYLTKPFAMGELLARIKALTRRERSYTPKVLSFGSVTLNTEEQELASQNTIRLGGKETKLMKFLLLNAGKALTTSDILSHVWDDEDATEETVWIYVSYLRRKLDSIGADVSIAGQKGGSFVLKGTPEAAIA